MACIILYRTTNNNYWQLKKKSCGPLYFTMSLKYLPDVIKGDADYRTYRPILLDNGITVLLANDPQSKHFAGKFILDFSP